MIFINSMSDLYLEDVPLANIQRVFEMMNKADWHQFQVLTKRSKRLLEIADKLTWTANIWQGVSVENQHWTSRVEDLVKVPAKIKFVSAEPLLGPVDLTPWLDRIQWVICGGESGPGYRKMNLQWARAIRNQCISHKVAFLYKQSSGPYSGLNPLLDGRRWRQFPVKPLVSP
jgi:protein gp37